MSSRDLMDQKSKQILRINAGSANELDELFKAVMGPKDGQVPLSIPMRQRNLPASFFKPPDGTASASHSRESSLDATSFSPPLSHPSRPPNSPLSPASPPQASDAHNGLAINHSRAHSSPASLQQPLNANMAALNASTPQHMRHLSYDLDRLPLPPGWQMSTTNNGERYFINHIEKLTTWEDPRKKILQQQLQKQTQRLIISAASNNANNNPTSSTASNSSNGGSAQNLAPLPEGWEQSRTAEGDVYFINHVECTTSWFDPRLPMNVQSNPKAQAGNLLKPPPPFTVPPSLVAALQNMNTSGSNNSDSLRVQSQLRIQRLHLERDQMRQRQEEIMRQTFMLKNSVLDESSNNIASRLPPTTTGIDPFLGGTNSAINNDCHSRQESADSGLGLGPNYSLPHTPEDFLNNIDDAINRDDANNNLNRNANNDLGLDSLQVANLDLGTENMESDDLMSSLPDDFSADLLSNVEALLDTNNTNIMTWL